jgi:hypothetical protein
VKPDRCLDRPRPPLGGSYHAPTPSRSPRVAPDRPLTPAIARLSGCADDSDKPESRTAEQAVGVKPESSTTKSATPVTITEEKAVKTDVKVNVNDARGNR